MRKRRRTLVAPSRASRQASPWIGISRGLAGLTLRGRAFVAAGLTAIACAIVLGQSSLVRIGALALFLPLAAAFFVGRRRPQIRVRRALQPALLEAGETSRMELELSNDAGNGAGALLVEDQVPYALGTRPRFVLQGLGRTWRRTVTYTVRSDVRGRFTIGPLSIATNDPFGLLEIRTGVPGTATLTVTPRTVPLPRMPLTGGWGGTGEHRPQSFAAGSAEDVTVRPYRRGDELRRVHWHSSARIGELMVRQEEQPWEARATVLLDNRLAAHRGRGLGSSFELAVTAVASVALHLHQQGYAVQLATADTVHAEATAAAVLEQLATITVVGRPTLETTWSGSGAGGGLLVAALGAIGDRDVAALRRLRHHHTAALALAIDVEQWRGAAVDPDRAVTAPLTASAWRAVPVGIGDRLDTAWSDLAGGAAIAADPKVRR